MWGVEQDRGEAIFFFRHLENLNLVFGGRGIRETRAFCFFFLKKEEVFSKC